MNENNKKLISIVVPVFNEEGNVVFLYEKVSQIFFQNSEYCFEMIFVNDGSRDGSLKKMIELARNKKEVKLIDFSRNFGKEIALSAGCRYAKGEAVVTIDADLQHPPELIKNLLVKWKEGYDVIFTVREQNKGAGFFKKLTSDIYWWLFDRIAQVNSEPRSTDFRLMDSKVIKEFKKFSERGRIFRGIVDWMGFRRAKIGFVAPERRNGKPAYSYWKLFGLLVNSFTAFSLLPLKLAGYLGIAITLFSGVMIVIMFSARWFFNPLLFSPISFVVVINTFLIGIVLMSLGVIALYIARIHGEVTNRPLYIIRGKMNITED